MRSITAITLALATALPAATQPVMYSVLDLGPGAANAINAFGQIAGTSNNMAVRWEPNGQMTLLGTLGGTASQGLGINSSGQVVGNSQTAGNAASHAFVTTGFGFPVMSDLGTFGGSQSIAYAINDAGQVVGWSRFAGDVPLTYHAFRTTPGGVIDAASDLGAFGTEYSVAYGINGSGQVTGYSVIASGAGSHAFRTSATGTISTADDLGTFGGTSSHGVSINASGQVGGESNLPGNTTQHFFRSSPNGQPISIQDLGTLAFVSDDVHINALGVIVGDGYADAGHTIQIGFVFDTQFHNLNGLVPAGWNIADANGINDAGQIAAIGTFQGGPAQALLLSPMPLPEPSTLALTGLVGVWLAWRRSRRWK